MFYRKGRHGAAESRTQLTLCLLFWLIYTNFCRMCETAFTALLRRERTRLYRTSHLHHLQGSLLLRITAVKLTSTCTSECMLLHAGVWASFSDFVAEPQFVRVGYTYFLPYDTRSFLRYNTSYVYTPYCFVLSLSRFFLFEPREFIAIYGSDHFIMVYN